MVVCFCLLLGGLLAGLLGGLGGLLGGLLAASLLGDLLGGGLLGNDLLGGGGGGSLLGHFDVFCWIGFLREKITGFSIMFLTNEDCEIEKSVLIQTKKLAFLNKIISKTFPVLTSLGVLTGAFVSKKELAMKSS